MVSADAGILDAQSLREQLMAPHPMQRAMALHALECALDRHPASALCGEVGRFTARGIPYYALHDPHFQEWVGKAVSYWEKLQASPQQPVPLPRTRATSVRRAAA